MTWENVHRILNEKIFLLGNIYNRSLFYRKIKHAYALTE